MKRFTQQFSGLLVALLFGSALTLAAQGNHPTEFVVIQKTTLEDGSVSVQKKRLPEGEDVKVYVKKLREAGGKEVEIHVKTTDGNVVNISEDEVQGDGETILFIRKAREQAMAEKEEAIGKMRTEMDKMRIVLHEKNVHLQSHDFNWNFKHVENDRPFLGVYLDDDPQAEGIGVSNTVGGSGAEAAGLQGGDLIMSIAGNKLNSVEDLRAELARHKPGDKVPVQYIRNGQAMQTEVTLGKRRSAAWSMERDPCKVFIGVRLSGNGPEGKGIKIQGIIEDTPAEDVALIAGDVILALDGVEVNTFGECLAERNKHKPGDWFSLTVLRDGRPMQVQAQFRSCEEETVEIEEEVEEAVEEVVEQPVPQPQAPIVERDSRLQLEAFAAYPNPTFGRLMVEFQAEAVPTTVRILDMNGKTVYEEVLNQFDGYYMKELNLSGQTPGAYVLTIRQGDRVVSEKVVLLDRA
jgi:hypothetical protein